MNYVGRKLESNYRYVFTLTRIAFVAREDVGVSMKGAEFKENHLMFSCNCKHFMVFHRLFQEGRKYTQLIMINIDKTEIYTSTMMFLPLIATGR